MSSSLYGGQGSAPAGQMPQNTSTGNFGKPWKNKIPEGHEQFRQQQFTPEQMRLFQQSFGHVSPQSFTGRLAGGDQSAFGEVEAPALRQFNELQGGLASRFSGMGGQGALSSRNSSGFQNAANQQSSNFAQQLQSNRQGLQRQALQDLMGMSNDLLGQKPFNVGMVEKQQDQGFDWGGALGALGGGALGFFAGGPMGAMSGAQMGYGALGRGSGGTGGSGGFQSSPGWGGMGQGNGYNGPSYRSVQSNPLVQQAQGIRG
jgi:hypothetical protein